jgi:hypothetical protein
VVDLPPGSPASAELLWGKEVAPGQYEIENVPIWAYGIAYGDVVSTIAGDDDRIHFSKVLRKGGLLTVRAAGPSADREVFSQLCETMQHRAVATGRYSPSYCAFAMDPQTFRELESRIDDMALAGNIEVEIANDEDL